MEKHVITILTPAYNRGKELLCLFHSLENQSNKSFEWLIVDDGSTDNTAQIVQKMQKTAPFPIRYIRKNNGGKHTALNTGIALINSELVFIVDSDDSLVSNAIEQVIEIHKEFAEYNDICGYSFLRCFPNGKINGKPFDSDKKIGNYIEIRINSHDTHADKAEVFLSHALQEFPFPEFPGERFLGEDTVWIRMARKYKMVHVNQAIYIGTYLENGLTTNRRKHNIAAPVGCMCRAEEFMKPDISLVYRFKGALQYIVYGKFAGHSLKWIVNHAPNKTLVKLCVPLGMILYWMWK